MARPRLLLIVVVAACGEPSETVESPVDPTEDVVAEDTLVFPDAEAPDVTPDPEDSSGNPADDTPIIRDDGPVPEDSSRIPDDTESDAAADVDAEPPPVQTWIAYTKVFEDQIMLWKPDTGPVQIGTCGGPKGFEYVAPNHLYVACLDSDTIESVTLDGTQTTLYDSGDPVHNPEDVVLGPDGDLLYSSSFHLEFTVWRLSPAGGDPVGFAKMGPQENFGLAYADDGTLFWADVKGGGEVHVLAPGGTPQLLIDDFPNSFELRDMELGPDGRLYIVSKEEEGGLRVYNQVGSFLEADDLPDNGVGVAVASDLTRYVLVGKVTSAAGVYKQQADNGGGWEKVVDDSVKLGTLQIIEK